jgi:hypothetical protein
MDNTHEEKILNQTIFETINYNPNEDLSPLISNLSDTQKKDLIRRILNYSYKQGIYSLSEAEFISVLIRYL